jgi:hypothetical protein
VKTRVVRTDTLRLLTTPELDDFLRRVGDATAKLINMENYRRRQLFFGTGKIDYSWKSAWRRRFTDFRYLQAAWFEELPRGLPLDRGAMEELPRAVEGC